MPEGLDSAAQAFERAIDPAPSPSESTPGQRQPATRRDEAGRFAQVAEKPEPFLEIRMIEGDPETGDTSDGGDDPRLVRREKEVLAQREREIADGRFDERAHREAADARRSRQTSAETERQSGERRRPDGAERDDAAADDGHSGADAEPEGAEANAAGDEAGEGESGDDDLENSQFEITVDGEPQTVSLGELRDGYIRTATFHSRLNKVNEHKAAVDQENSRVVQMRDLYINGLRYLDEDIQALTPAEPDWDQEYARDPLSARRKQKQYQEVYAKLHQIRGQRAWAIQNQKEEHDRGSAKYAIEQFTQFVQDHPKVIKDEPSLHQVIGGMRKTALAEGFTEPEVAGVYDKRMLNILFKAWLYDQGMAVRPRAVISGQGKALVPGSATPIGNAGRRNIDEAKRQLARTGKMEDATAYFQRLLT